jgi:hypothetical protein
MVISAGGYFVKRNDTLDYQGGETRLVSIPAAAKFQDLVDSLDRVASGSITSASSIGLGQVRHSDNAADDVLEGNGWGRVQGVCAVRGRFGLVAAVCWTSRQGAHAPGVAMGDPRQHVCPI